MAAPRQAITGRDAPWRGVVRHTSSPPRAACPSPPPPQTTNSGPRGLRRPGHGSLVQRRRPADAVGGQGRARAVKTARARVRDRENGQQKGQRQDRPQRAPAASRTRGHLTSMRVVSFLLKRPFRAGAEEGRRLQGSPRPRSHCQMFIVQSSLQALPPGGEGRTPRAVREGPVYEGFYDHQAGRRRRDLLRRRGRCLRRLHQGHVEGRRFSGTW